MPIRTGALKAFGEVKAPIRKCIACNVCFERLTLEKDVACVHNPVIGTEFEALEHAEPQLFPAQRDTIQRAAHAGAGRGRHRHRGGARGRRRAATVSKCGRRPPCRADRCRSRWRRPDKKEVEPVWTYRWEEVQALGVPVRICDGRERASRYELMRPTSSIVATGAQAARVPVRYVAAFDSAIDVVHAWDVLREPRRVAARCRRHDHRRRHGRHRDGRSAESAQAQAARWSKRSHRRAGHGAQQSHGTDRACGSTRYRIMLDAKSSSAEGRTLELRTGDARLRRSTSAMSWSSRPGLRRTTK